MRSFLNKIQRHLKRIHVEKDTSLEKIEAMRKAVITALDERAAKLALDGVKPQSSLFARASQSY